MTVSNDPCYSYYDSDEFPFFLLFSIDEDENLAVSNDPCYSYYDFDDESNYGSSNSEI